MDFISGGSTIDGLSSISATIDGLGSFSFDSQYWLSGGRSLARSEEHTSELQSPLIISYAVFCLKKKTDEGIFFTREIFHARLIAEDAAAGNGAGRVYRQHCYLMAFLAEFRA